MKTVDHLGRSEVVATLELRIVIIINKQQTRNVKNSNYQGNRDYEMRGKRKKSKAKVKKQKKNKKTT